MERQSALMPPTTSKETGHKVFRRFALSLNHFVRHAEASFRGVSLRSRVVMDAFCRCIGCAGCSGTRNPLGGCCDKEPQRYTVKRRNGEKSDGFRKFCKPCLRVQEQQRAVGKKQVSELGYHPRNELINPLSGGAHDLNGHGHDHVPGNRPRIVLFGDSITEQSFGEGGFGGAFADKYKRHADVILRGYSGYNSRDAVALLRNVFPTNDPTPPVLVTVCFGANDAVAEGSFMEKIQGCPLDEYQENLNSILEHLSKLNPPPAVLLMTPPPVNPVAWKQTCDDNNYHGDEQPDRTLNRTGAYAHAALGVAR